MKCYCEIGERTKWRGKQYRCVESIAPPERENCEACGLRGEPLACQLTACKSFQRADRKDVYFRLEPRFRKEKKQ